MSAYLFKQCDPAKSLVKLKQTKEISFKIQANAPSSAQAYSEPCLRSKFCENS